MPQWADAERCLVIVLDQSGSMGDVIEDIRQGCLALERCAGPQTCVHYIVFDETASAGPSLQAMPFKGGGTSIRSAFRELHALLFTQGTPKKLDVVFVSDGEDHQMEQCKRALAQMKPPGCPSRLFSVGVRADFPTTLVTDLLYPVFGRDSDPSAPAVLPLESGEEAEWVFQQLGSYVNDASAGAPPSVEDFTEDSSMDELCTGAQRAYNACMHGCLFSRTSSDLAALTRCEEILARIARLSLDAVVADKRAARQPALPSRLLALYGDTTPLDALTLARKLHVQVSDILLLAAGNPFVQYARNAYNPFVQYARNASTCTKCL